MRDNGYDLRQYLERNWPSAGRDLEGLHVDCNGNYYLNLAVYLLEELFDELFYPPEDL